MTGAHLAEAALSEDAVHPERLVGHVLLLEVFPLEVAVKIHGLLELAEGFFGEVAFDFQSTLGEQVPGPGVHAVQSLFNGLFLQGLDELVGVLQGVLARVHAGVGGGRTSQVFADQVLGALDPELFRLQLVGVDGVQELVVVVVFFLVLEAELEEEPLAQGLLVHDVVVADGGQLVLEIDAGGDVGEGQQLAPFLAPPFTVVRTALSGLEIHSVGHDIFQLHQLHRAAEKKQTAAPHNKLVSFSFLLFLFFGSFLSFSFCLCLSRSLFLSHKTAGGAEAEKAAAVWFSASRN